MIKEIRRVSFEISNLCNFASWHKDCIAHQVKKPIILSSAIVANVIDYLAQNQYKGIIAWYIYNEPLIDPRLISFLNYTRKRMRKNIQRILTNGYYLDQNMIDELAAAGLNYLKIQCYREQEYQNVSKLNFEKIAWHKIVRKTTLDDRLLIHDQLENHLKMPCFAPYGDVCIRSTGEITLCCIDWRNDHVLADLRKESFEDAIAKKSLREIYERLKIGDRFLPICARCLRGIYGFKCKRAKKRFTDDY